MPGGLIQDFRGILTGWDTLMENDFVSVEASKLGDPSDGRFECPAEIEHTKTNVDARRKAESNLDRFWRAVDKALKTHTDKVQHGIVQRIFKDNGPMRRTAPWTQSSQPERAGSRETEYDFYSFSEIFHDSSKEITGNFNRLSIANKTKAKTRGISATKDSATLNPAPHREDTHTPLYHVDKDSFTVFKMLFHTPENGELPGKLRWNHVVAALTKLGFSAEKLLGSAWQFTPRTIKLTRGIQFHEPHPDGEVSLWLARRYGRHLARTYGWDGTMFKQK